MNKRVKTCKICFSSKNADLFFGLFIIGMPSLTKRKTGRLGKYGKALRIALH